MAITFGGLATGLDTNAIISAILEVERQPLIRMEKEKSYLSSRLEAFSQFESKLDTLSSSISEMNGVDKLGSYATRSGSEDFFSLAVGDSTLATKGSYQLEVVNLAQVEKDVSNGYTDANADIFRRGTVTVEGTSIQIPRNSSLNDIRDAINQADEDSGTGVTATTIFDGTNYRLVLTGPDAATDFDLRTQGLGVPGAPPRLTFTTTQTAEMAEVTLDGITITSGSNRIENAIPGISIDLLKENTPGETTTISVDTDYTEINTKMEAFAAAYNDINTFISEQEDSDWASDPAFRTVTRSLSNLLTTDFGGSGSYNHLVNIGFKTDPHTGLISVDSSKLNEALTTDYDSVENLLIGDGVNTGLLERFSSYLDTWTDTVDGLYASKKETHDSAVRSLDLSIERMELRLEKREQTLMAQFSAMEDLVNSLNSTSSYLSQQLANMPTIGNQQ